MYSTVERLLTLSICVAILNPNLVTRAKPSVNNCLDGVVRAAMERPPLLRAARRRLALELLPLGLVAAQQLRIVDHLDLK